MPRKRAQGNSIEDRGSEAFDAAFARKMAEINAALADIESAVAESRKRSFKPPPPVAAPIGMHAAAVSAAAATTAAPAAPPPLPPAPPIPTGTDLSDPKNYGVLPPVAELERGEDTTDQYRQRLSTNLLTAEKILHTSGVPAAVWREWRVFEKTIRERLLELSGPV